MRPRAFTGIVLAGGRSSRMGRDKALLTLDGHTLLDAAIARLRQAGATRVLVSGDRPAHDGVPDHVPGLGPVGGLASVLKRCPDGLAVVVPVDMPRLEAQRLMDLRDALQYSRAAHFRFHPLPCALTVDAATREAIASQLAAAAAGPSMWSLLGALRASELDIGDAHTLDNVNTPAEWEALSR
jgi:molybdopterin-guanine dinucleotide biosynthesis protein A